MYASDEYAIDYVISSSVKVLPIGVARSTMKNYPAAQCTLMIMFV